MALAEALTIRQGLVRPLSRASSKICAVSQRLRAATPWIVCVVIIGALNAFWMMRHGAFARPQMSDAATWHFEAQQFHSILLNQGVTDFLWAGHTHPAHPPLLAMSAAAVAAVCSRSVDSTTLFLTMLLFSALYFWAAARVLRLWLAPMPAACALALCACLPPLFTEARLFSANLAAAAISLAAFDQLLRSARYRNTWRALAAGTLAGFAALVSNMGALCLPGALVWANVLAFADGDERILRARMRNLFYVVNMGLLVVSPWYLAHHEDAWRAMDSLAAAAAVLPHACDAALLSVKRFAWFPLEVLRSFGVAFVALFVWAAWRMLPRRSERAAPDATHHDTASAGQLPPREQRHASAIVASGAGCAVILLVVLRPAGALTSLLPLLPFGALLLVQAVLRSAQRKRAAWCTALCALLLVGSGQRGAETDNPVLAVNGIGLLPQADRQLVLFARKVGVPRRNAMEAWPIDASVAAALALSPEDVALLCVLHALPGGTPGLEPANFRRVAAESGRALSVTSVEHTAADATALRPLALQSATLVLADDAACAVDLLVAAGRANNAAVDVTRKLPLVPGLEVAARQVPGAARTFTLYEFSRPGARPRRLRPAQWAALPTLRSNTPLEHGWVCLGCEYAADASGARTCTLFLDSSASDATTLQAVLVAEDASGRISVQRHPLEALCAFDPDRTVVALRFALPPMDGVRRAFRVAAPGLTTRALRIADAPPAGVWMLPTP